MVIGILFSMSLISAYDLSIEQIDDGISFGENITIDVEGNLIEGIVSNIKIEGVDIYKYKDEIGTETAMKELECSDLNGVMSKGACDVEIEEEA